MILPSGTIILVADGARMLLLRNAGDAIDPDLQVIEHRQCQSLSSRELASDAPGVNLSSGGKARHGYDKGDPHDSEEVHFLHSAANALDKVIDDDTKPVIIAAPPRALAILRRAYSASVKNLLSTELDKDFTHLPVNEIAQRLAALEYPD